MKEREAIERVEKQLGIEHHYHFTISQVRTYLDDDIESLKNDPDMHMFTFSSLEKLAKEVKKWMRRRRVSYVEHNDLNGTLSLTMDTRDLGITATVHSYAEETGDIELTDGQMEAFVKAIQPKQK